MKAVLSTGALTLALLLSGCGKGDDAGGNATAKPGTPVAAVPAPNGGDWTETVVQTPEGGMMMGNPAAPVKLVEFGSMTCPHCAEFTEKSGDLINKYVKSGRVSYEFRNYVRDPADLAAALLARCGGPAPFFKLSEQMYAAQRDWVGKLQNMTPAEQQQLQNMQPEQVVPVFGEKSGLVQFVAMRGVPAEKANQCLADKAAIQKLVDITNSGNELQIPGTPTFLINGKMVENSAAWDTLEPRLKEALGE